MPVLQEGQRALPRQFRPRALMVARFSDVPGRDVSRGSWVSVVG